MNTKKCVVCDSINLVKTRTCRNCGHKFINEESSPIQNNKNTNDAKIEILLKRSIHSKLSDINDQLNGLTTLCKANFASMTLNKKSNDEQYRKIVERIASLQNANKKQTWVSVSVIQEITNWDKYDLRKARKNNLVQVKNDGKKIMYLIESIHPFFIKKMQENNDNFVSP